MKITEIEKKERGILLREIRKNQGKKMTDLEDENISRGTIGNIETCTENVSEEKVRYYCSLLNIKYEDIPKLIEEKRKKDEQKEKGLYFKLKMIENVIDHVGDRTGLQMIKEIDEIPAELENFVYYLKGKAYVYLDETDQAERKFVKAIEASDKKDYTNIKSCAYNELGKLSYYKNSFGQAIDYTEQGIKAFQHEGERKHIYFSLFANKVLYLDKLDKTIEAAEILKEIWKEKHKINHMSVLLNLYDLHGGIYKKLEMYDDAIKYVEEGLELARINQEQYRAVELWTTLGSIYIEMKKLTIAEDCLNIALKLKEKLSKKYLFTTVYVKLGELYMEQGKFDLARKKLSLAIKNKGKKANISKYIKALTVLGDCFLLQEQTQKSIHYYQEALSLAEKHSFTHQEHEILRRLCIAYSKTDRKEYKKTLDRYFCLDVQLNERSGGVSTCLVINQTKD